MKIKKKTTKYTTVGEQEQLRKEREGRDGMQFELTPTALDHWEKKKKKGLV